MPELQKVIGLMSGTSLDGVDAALVETDGEDIVRPGPSLTIPYQQETRALLRAALDTARDVAEGAAVPQSIREATRELTVAHADAVTALLAKAGLAAADVALIGFHGQTILHRPAQRWTWQIGDGALLARLTGIDVVNDFRSADVKAGGQGAPLVPLYHAALLRQPPLPSQLCSAPDVAAPRVATASPPSGRVAPKGEEGLRFAAPVAVVNIGGVGNVTYIDGDTVIAFDTGPGNAPIDDWMARHSGRPVDEDGAFAATGQVNDAALEKMLANAFFARLPPKSLDRMDFGMAAVEGLSPADGAATLTAFTAASIAKARDHFPEVPATWIICGGGRHNKTLMAMLKARTNAPVIAAEDAGWNGDALEAEAFAYLAMRSVKGLPLSLPTTTGVPQPMTGGKLHHKP
jgi:anhydro-N-acetylmuramic acid kinase